jgi:glutamate-1-semialdehyde 2,1-aminomutase
MNILPGGTVKTCCAYGHPIEQDGRQMSVYTDTVAEIWNSDEMRNLRRSMVEGKPVAACNYCYVQERQGLRSMWTSATDNWKAGVQNPAQETVQQLKDRVRANDFKILPGPEWLDLNVGNQCNLKCRMCNPEFSTGIANDPVHSRWSGFPELPARWHGNSLLIAPRPVLGVLYEGFGNAEPIGRAYRSWTDGNAVVRLKARDLDISRLAIKLAVGMPANIPVTITINDIILFSGQIPLELEFDIPPLKENDELEICLHSPLFTHPETDQPVGVGIEEIRLIRSSTGKSSVALSRFQGGMQWFQENEFLIGELFAYPERFTQLNIIGGEPLLIKEVRTILRHLIDSGVSNNIVLGITTNGSFADDEWFELTAKFEAVHLAISVDGYGKVNEYIRFPSDWQKIAENVAKFGTQSNNYCAINLTVQAYNILNIVEVVEFCDRVGIGFRAHLLQHPDYLSPFVLPLDIRHVAAERLRAFATKRDSTPEQERHGKWAASEVLLSLASMLEGGPADINVDLLHRFMLFTNDIDTSRGQSFTKALPELNDLLEYAGFPWVGDLKYA